MDEKKKNTKLFLKGTVLVSLMGGLVAFVILATIMFYNYMDNQFVIERQEQLVELTDKVADITNTAIDTSWQMVDVCKNYFVFHDNSKDIMDSVKEISALINKENHVVFAFDENMQFYASDGHSGQWITGFDKEVQKSTIITTLPCDTDKTYMLFIEKLANPKTLNDGKVITHMAVGMDFDYLDSLMTVERYKGKSVSFVVNSRGDLLHTLPSYDRSIIGSNVVESIEQKGTVDKAFVMELAKRIYDRQPYSFEIDHGGTDYVVATAALGEGDWSLMLFVPIDALNARLGGFMETTLLYFVFIMFSLLLVFSVEVYILTKNRINKRLLIQQEKENATLLEEASINKRESDAKSEFLTHMSHDIRTPINGIMGMTDIALKNIDSKDRVEDCLHKIEGSSKHLLSLVNDVLDMSRIESGKTKANREQMDIRQIAENCASIIGGQLASRDINFVTEFDDFQFPLLVGDELHLRQVIINILGNAVKFTPDGGSIFFRIKERGEKDGKALFHIEVEDTGIGMKKEFLEHIWEAFSQEDNGSRTNYKGTGLGMAITKKFVELMGGTIEVESELNKGSKFLIDLTFDIDYSGQVCDIPWAKKDFTGTKILLVEDNELNMEIAQILLEDEGIIVTTAENGKVAVDKVTESEPGTFDVILMDVMMPVMNGLEATKAIRSMDREDAKTIPIIAMTANAFEDDIKKTKEAGMNEHLSKPIEMALVLRMLGRYL